MDSCPRLQILGVQFRQTVSLRFVAASRRDCLCLSLLWFVFLSHLESFPVLQYTIECVCTCRHQILKCKIKEPLIMLDPGLESFFASGGCPLTRASIIHILIYIFRSWRSRSEHYLWCSDLPMTASQQSRSLFKRSFRIYFIQVNCTIT